MHASTEINVILIKHYSVLVRISAGGLESLGVNFETSLG